MPENKDNKNNPEEKKKEIAKAFGLNLEDIQHYKLDNGHEIFKFADSKDQSIKLIENIDYGTNMEDLFKGTQNSLTSAQTDDSKGNARDIYMHNLNQKNMELKLITIAEFKANKWKYKRVLRNMSTRIRTQIKFLLKNSKKLNLKYINLDYGIGLNEKGEIIDVQVDFINRRVNIEVPQVVKYSNKSVDIDDQEYEVNDVEFEGLFSGINFDGNEPTAIEARDITIDGETINTKNIVDFYNTPELMDKMNINDKQKSIYSRVINKITKRIGKEVKKDNRQFTLKNNHKNTDKKAS